jgi:signal transduction histidine kinase
MVRPWLRQTYPLFVSLLGIAIILFNLFQIHSIKNPLIFLLLLSFIWICEHFFIPTDNYGSSLVLPIIFTISILWSLPIALLSLTLISIIDGLLSKRWNIKNSLYPFKLAISLEVAMTLSFRIKNGFNLNLDNPFYQLIWSLFFTLVFFTIKTSLKYTLDLVREIEPIERDKSQIGWVFLIVVITFIYCWLFLFVGHQNRGKIDVLSYFFFFSPLVAVSVLSSIISRLQRERRRLNSLFGMTSLMNSKWTSEDPVVEVVHELRNLIAIDGSLLFLKTDGQWTEYHKFGLIQPVFNFTLDDQDYIKKLEEDRGYKLGDFSNAFISKLFKKEILATAEAPLKIEGELIGIWIIGSKKINRYNNEDYQTLATLANQVAAIIKTRRFMQEKEEHKIFQERNRIAREIHDGIAQSLAAAIMNLELSEKSFFIKPEESFNLISSSLCKLRNGLSQVRESIYALRPDPFEKVGIVQAIQERVKIFKEENPDMQVKLMVKGDEEPLDYRIEKGIFDIFRESLRNIEKHSNATKVRIYVGYMNGVFGLVVIDNGDGFLLGETLIKARKIQNFGLQNMNELSELIGADLDIQAKKGQGTRIFLNVPYSNEGEEAVND